MGIFSLFSQSLINEKYIFFDVETTGLYPLCGDRVVEIAMIKTSKGKIVDTINTFLNPGIKIPDNVTKINNITNEMIENSPIFDKEFSGNLLNFIEDGILVAHNAEFDISFVSMEFGRNGITFDQWQAIDTLKMAEEIFPGQKNKLENLIRRFDVMPEGELHRALVDTDAVRKIFFEFLEETKIRSLNIIDLIKKYGFKGQFVYKDIPAKIREAIIEKKTIRGVYRSREGNLLDISFLPLSSVWIEQKWFLLAEESESKKILSLFCENFIEIN